MSRKKQKKIKKPEDFGRFSEALLKKEYGDEYQIITQKDYKDLTKGQKKLFDQTVQNYDKKQRGSNKLLVIGAQNKPSLGIPPRTKFSDLREIDYRSAKMRPTNEMLMIGVPRFRRKNQQEKLEDSRREVQGDIDYRDVAKGKVSASYSGQDEGVNPRTGIPVSRSNPRMRIIKELKYIANTPDYGKERQEAARQQLKSFSKKVLGRANGGSVLVKTKLGRTKPTKVY